MKLKQLSENISKSYIVGNVEVEVLRPCYDSRVVKEGDLFCAIKGKIVDGNRFINQAVKAGASAILTSEKNLKVEIPVLIVEDDREAMALAAHELYGNPTKDLKVIGITGTNGKTTSTYILQSILNAAGFRTAIIGTIGWVFEDHGEELARTTPEAPDLLEILSKIRDLGATHVVMEVTSIALPMKRVAGFNWLIGLFTNLSQDHLDLHETMDEYFEAKKSFFRMISKSNQVVANIDDPYGSRIIEGINAHPISFGFKGGEDVHAEVVSMDVEGIKIKLSGHMAGFEINAPYVGQFNAENVVGCAVAALAIGVEPEIVKTGIENAPQVRGRMERLILEGDITAFVDYSHTPDAIQRALEAVKPMAKGKVRIVFGAGGDRDKTKRAEMGRIASEYSDYVYVTSDNPRTEDPISIINDILQGAKGSHVTTAMKRRMAIRIAIEESSVGDVILVSGKGHETYQDINGIKYHFNDVEEILNVRGRKC
jgi:UDP-N-acetylmuramoyl-L-alanyl-D-glutamate--2,6-diaminopimelate ligase